MLKKTIFTAGFIAVSGSLPAADFDNNLDIDINSDSVRVAYEGPLSTSNLNMNASFFHTDEDQVDVDMISAGIHVAGRSKASTGNQRTGIGAKLVSWDADNVDGGSIALGGFLRHTLATADLISIRGDLYYAPGVTSFGDADDYLEFGVRGEYQLMENATVYLGFRNIESDIEVGGGTIDAEFEDDPFIGISLLF